MDLWDEWLKASYFQQPVLKVAGVDEQTYKDAATNPVDQALGGAGILPKKVNGAAPGASVDVGQANGQQQWISELLQQLQQQAATGSGSWEGALQAATQKAQGTASALGQSAANQGGDVQSGLMNIGNAQSAASQRAVGEGNILREQSKQDAQDQLGPLLGAQGQTDIEQANVAARAKQQVGAANLALIDQAQQNMSGIQKAIPFSDGGEVPGKPKVFGNDERNDTRPAMLSPEEVVLPRTISHDPKAAAAFVAALNQGADPHTALQHASGAPHMADGGGVDQTSLKDYGDGNAVLSIIAPHIGSAGGYGSLRDKAAAGPASIENGGLLDTANFDATRAARAGLQAQLMDRARGAGPSVAPQMMQNANDAAIAEALAAQQRGAPAASVVTGGADAAQLGGGDAAAQRAKEQSSGQRQAGAVGTQARAQELSMAEAQQQAAWSNTMQNLGLSLANQAALRNMFAGAGQAFTAASGAQNDHWGSVTGGGGDQFGDPSSAQTHDLGDLGSDELGGGGDETGDTSSTQTHDDPGLAFGGTVNYADGGRVSPDYLELPDTGMRVPMPEGDAVPVPRKESREERKAAEHEEETGYAAPKGRETATAHAARKAAEYQEEVGGPMPAKHAKPKPASSDSMFARALQAAGRFAQSASASLPRFAEGGSMPNFTPAVEASYPPSFVDPSLWGYMPPDQVRPGELPPGVPRAEAPVLQSRYPAPAGTTSSGPMTPAEQAISRDMGAPPTVAHANAEKAQQDRSARESLGIRPGLAPSSSPSGTPNGEPSVAAKPSGGGGGISLPKPADRSELNTQTEASINAQADLEAQKAHAQATGDAERQRVANEYALREKDVHDRARMFTDDAFTRLKAAQEEMSRVDASVDPGRYWASRTTGQKILGIIGLALGAAGSGPDGINRAAQMMNQAIDRDVDAQKAEFEARLKKGGQRVAAAQNFYSMARESGLDQVAATHAAKAAALESVALKTESTIASINEPIAKAKGQALVLAARGGAKDKEDAAKQRTFENRVQLGSLAAQQAAAAHRGGLSEGERKSVGDVTAAAKDAMGLINSIEGALARTQSAIPGKTTFNQHVGGDAAQLDTDTAQLVVKMKDINKLGQLGPADSKLLEEAIGDPKAIFTLESTKRAKLERVKQIIRDSVSNERSARGL